MRASANVFMDDDGDGFGDPDNDMTACEPAEGYVSVPNDCDDTNADSYPGAPEQCDESDNDCDGVIDNGLQEWWYLDVDGDGFGDPEVSVKLVCPMRATF